MWLRIRIKMNSGNRIMGSHLGHGGDVGSLSGRLNSISTEPASQLTLQPLVNNINNKPITTSNRDSVD